MDRSLAEQPVEHRDINLDIGESSSDGSESVKSAEDKIPSDEDEIEREDEVPAPIKKVNIHQLKSTRMQVQQLSVYENFAINKTQQETGMVCLCAAILLVLYNVQTVICSI